jgi:hypothetical protein
LEQNKGQIKGKSRRQRRAEVTPASKKEKRGGSMKRSIIVMCAFAILSVFIVKPLCAPVPPPLMIKRIELYFENNRPEITIDKDYQKLKTYAKITFAYSGLLEGHWEVDGKIISRVSEHLTTGNIVFLETPDALQLPTFDPGTHVVHL